MNWRLVIGQSVVNTLSEITWDHNYYATEKMLIYTPPNYNSSIDYPVLFFLHGAGETGMTQEFGYLAGTGNGSQTVFSGNLNNTEKIVHSSVYVQVNGVTVATGRRGVITGDGVTGTYSIAIGTSATFSVTFTVAPTSGHEVRIFYAQSNLFGQGTFKYLNEGDEPENIIIIAPQQVGSFVEFDVVNHWENPITYLINNGYGVDTNRLYSTGLSLGGVMGTRLITNVDTVLYPVAAFVDVSPGRTIEGDYPIVDDPVWDTTTNVGKLIVRGATDTNGTALLPRCMERCNNEDRGSPYQGLIYWNIGHSSTLWDGKVYNRKNRTNGGGAADFDYIDEFLMLYSLDNLEQATLWVDRAELTLDSGDYRFALNQVNNLSASAEKTALLARLDTVLSGIGIIAIIDLGVVATTTAGNHNNLTATTAGSTITNLVRYDTGAATVWDFEMDTVSSTTGTYSFTRLMGRQFGLELNTTKDAHRLHTDGSVATALFTSLDDAKTYTLKFYASQEGFGNPTSRSELQVVIGATTKSTHVYLSNFFAEDGAAAGGYVVFKNVAPSSGTISAEMSVLLSADTEGIVWLQAIEIIEEA